MTVSLMNNLIVKAAHNHKPTKLKNDKKYLSL